MADDRRKQQAWRSGNARPALEPGPKRRGGGKRFAVLALILAIVGVIAGLLYFLWPDPPPLSLGVAVTQYTDPSYPRNAWAQQDSEGIRGHFPSDSAQAFQAQQRNSLLDLFGKLPKNDDKSKDKKRPVLIHLSALGVVRGGKVYLLPAEANPDKRDTWLPLEDVLDKVRQGSSPRLLLLDLAKPVADAHAGLLTVDVADALDAELTKANLPFLVLTACAKGEVAHASPELQRSVFGYFIEQALLGYADGWNPAGEKNDRVSARELIEYVRAQVAHWAAGQRLSPQTPTPHGRGDDFVLVSRRKPTVPLKLPDPPPDYPKWLEEGWKERDDWQTAAVYRQMPRTFRELETILLRAERRWMAGDKEETIQSEFKGKFEDLKKQRLDLKPKSFAPRSVAQARRDGLKENKAIENAVRKLRDRINTTKQPLKPDDLMPLREMFKEKPPVMDKPPDPLPFPELAHHTLSALLELDDLSPELLKEFGAILIELEAAGRFIEMAALRFLANLDARTQENWNKKEKMVDLRHLVLDAALASEEAVAIDPRTLPWLQADIAEADKKHRSAIVLLSTGGIKERELGLEELTDAVKGFRQITASARVLENGFEQLEEANTLLPALVAPLGRSEPDEQDKRFWADLIANTIALRQLLNPPKSPVPAPVDQLVPLNKELKSKLSRIKEKYGPAEVALRVGLAGKENGPTADELRQLLDSPLWNLKGRLDLYDAARKLGQTTAAAGLTRATQLTPASPPPPASARLADSPAWRARLAIDLLRLDGLSDVGLLEGLLTKAVSGGPDEWHTLADAIRKAWAVTLPEAFRDSNDAAVRERAGIVLHVVDVSSLPELVGRQPAEPSPELRRRQKDDFWKWLALERYKKAAAAFMAVPNRNDLKDFGTALDKIRSELQNATP